MNVENLRQFSLQGVALCLLCSVTFAQSSLPKEAREDILRQQLTAAYDAGDYKQTLNLLDEYKRLTGRSKFPTPMYFAEAIAAEATQDLPRALAALEDYLAKASKDSPHYSEAIQRYPRVREAANKETGGLVDLVERLAGVWRTPVGGDGCGLPKQTVSAYSRIDARAYTRRAYIPGGGGTAYVQLDVSATGRDGWAVVAASLCPMILEVDPSSSDRATIRVADGKKLYEDQVGYWCKSGNSASLTIGEDKLRLKGNFFSRDTCPSGNPEIVLDWDRSAR